jgi:hypothetical protein
VYTYYPTLLPPKRFAATSAHLSAVQNRSQSSRSALDLFLTRLRCPFEDQSYRMDAGENRSNLLANRTVRWETQFRDGSDDFCKDGATLDAVV